MNKKLIREVNGYRLVYNPNHKYAMQSKNWGGYIYEHTMVMCNNLGRQLHSNEVIHHLDGNKHNNRLSNLIVLTRANHMRMHMWLDNGAPYSKEDGKQGMNSGKSKIVHSYCKICDITLQNTQKKCCSRKCYAILASKNIPSKDILVELLHNNSKSAIGRQYNVSCNAVIKWMKKYDI